MTPEAIADLLVEKGLLAEYARAAAEATLRAAAAMLPAEKPIDGDVVLLTRPVRRRVLTVR